MDGGEKTVWLCFKGRDYYSKLTLFFRGGCKVMFKQTSFLHALSVHHVLKCQPLLLTHELLPNEILIVDGGTMQGANCETKLNAVSQILWTIALATANRLALHVFYSGSMASLIYSGRCFLFVGQLKDTDVHVTLKTDRD